MKTARDVRKLELLKHYEGKEAHAFGQFDAFVNAPRGDAVVHPDEDGDAFFSGLTYELMSGGPAVRVLATSEASVKDVRRVLRKMRRMFKTNGFGFNVADAEKALDTPVCPHCGKNPEEEPIPF